jgi:hypothetical protein
MTVRNSLVAAVALLLLAAGVSPAAAIKRRAFVTSLKGSGNIPSWPGSTGATALDRADSICRARAAAAALPNAATYRAWLSTATTDAYCHVQGLNGTKASACNGASQPGGGPWYLVNGITPFTPDLATLTGPDRVVYRGVYLDEFGDEVLDAYDGHVWTGTGPDGTRWPQDCSGWTTGSGDVGGWFGTARGGSPSWTDWGWHGCSNTKRLLCFEPGASETPSTGWFPGSLAFVTSADGLGNLSMWPAAGGQVGIDAGDAICRSLAEAAHLPEPTSFFAWLSDDFTDAGDRLTVNGPFRRIDGFSIAGSKADLLNGTTANSLHIDENGTYVQQAHRAYTGTAADGTATGFDCNNWTNEISGSGTYGYANLARDDSWTAYADNGGCYGDHHLLCFSNRVVLFWDGFEYSGDASRWSSSVP